MQRCRRPGGGLTLALAGITALVAGTAPVSDDRTAATAGTNRGSLSRTLCRALRIWVSLGSGFACPWSPNPPARWRMVITRIPYCYCFCSSSGSTPRVVVPQSLIHACHTSAISITTKSDVQYRELLRSLNGHSAGCQAAGRSRGPLDDKALPGAGGGSCCQHSRASKESFCVPNLNSLS